MNDHVREFERILDQELDSRISARLGGTKDLRLAAAMVEYAWATDAALGDRLMEGLQVLAPSMVGRVGGSITIEDLLRDLDFGAHYFLLRVFLYYTYNSPRTISWTFDGGDVNIRFLERTLPRQFLISANNMYLTSSDLFRDSALSKQIEELVRGTPEFSETARSESVLELIEEEVDLKLSAYFNLVADSFVSVGRYSFQDFVDVYRLLLAKALYHRYHTRVSSSHGCINMPLAELTRDLISDTTLTHSTVERVIKDISYGASTKEEGLDPLYFSLFRIDADEDIHLLPHHFAVWEGFVNFLRVIALRDPKTYLNHFSGQIGASLTRRVADSFGAAGFLTRTNVSLSAFQTDLPDIDVLVISEEPTFGYVVVICEVKAPLPPRWAKDQLRVLQPDSISKAFRQLQAINDFLGTTDGTDFLISQVLRLSPVPWNLKWRPSASPLPLGGSDEVSITPSVRRDRRVQATCSTHHPEEPRDPLRPA